MQRPLQGTYLPDTPGNDPDLIDLEGVHVWVEEAGTQVQSTYTLANGYHEFNDIPVTAPFIVTVKADLMGQWVTVDSFGDADIIPVPALVNVTSFPAADIDFIFNPPGHNEFDTAQVNTLVHVTKAHEFWKRFQPDVSGLDSSVDFDARMSYYERSTNLVMQGEQV